jgi:hypothetical protein
MTPPAPVKPSTIDREKYYCVYGPNLGAEKHTFSEALETEKASLKERQKEDPPPLYAPQSGQPLPPKHPCFDGVPTLPDKIVVQAVLFGKTSLPRDPLSRDLSKDEAAAFSKNWGVIDAEEAEFKRYGFSGVFKSTDPKPEGAYTFDEALTQPWCRYKNRKWFDAFINKYGYPESMRKLGWITQIGYQILLETEKTARRDENKKSQDRLRSGSGSQSPKKPAIRKRPKKRKRSMTF